VYFAFASRFHDGVDFFTDFRAVTEIHDFMRNNYAWSLDVDNTAGSNTTIGNFLFDTRMGHCALYASAMTLAVRRLGIPARYVTGVVTVGGGGQVQELAERDFHAWVEVYFAGVGWIPFDPTGGAQGSDGGRLDLPPPAPMPPTPPPTSPPATPPTSPRVTPPTSPTDSTTTPAGTTSANVGDTGNTDGGGFGAAVAGIARTAVLVAIPIAILAAILLMLRKLKQEQESRFERWRSSGESGDYGKNAQEMYRFMFKLFKAGGVSIQRGETPSEFAERIDSRSQEGDAINAQELGAIMPIFQRLEFAGAHSGTFWGTLPGSSALTQDEYNEIYGYVSALYEQTVLSRKAPARLAGQIRLRRV
jgi:hypothetical protein